MSTRPRPAPRLDGRRGTVTLTQPLAGAVEAPLARVLPDPTQPRKDWRYDDGDERLDELVASIAQFGILQPLLVRMDPESTDVDPLYRIIAGARRRAAAERAGLRTIPVVVRTEDVARIRVLQLIENLQRQDLSPLDEARAYEALMDLKQLSPPGVAECLHISAQKVRERLRLLADQVLADAVQRRQISATAARDIARLPDDEVEVFRQRIRAGEVLQSNDVATARARLAAAGIVNPRLKRAATPPQKQASLVFQSSMAEPEGEDAVGPAPTPCATPQGEPSITGRPEPSTAGASAMTDIQEAGPSRGEGEEQTPPRGHPQQAAPLAEPASGDPSFRALVELVRDRLVAQAHHIVTLRTVLERPDAARWAQRIFEVAVDEATNQVRAVERGTTHPQPHPDENTLDHEQRRGKRAVRT